MKTLKTLKCNAILAILNILLKSLFDYKHICRIINWNQRLNENFVTIFFPQSTSQPVVRKFCLTFCYRFAKIHYNDQHIANNILSLLCAIETFTDMITCSGRLAVMLSHQTGSALPPVWEKKNLA